jgi:hypothetical protein
MRLLVTSASALLATAALALGAPLTAQAAAYSVVGNDVSWPQCGTTLPSDAGFGVVGLNDGLANTTNPCFADQLAWAQGLAPTGSQPNAQLYVNTANPGKQGKWWPTTNRTQSGTAVAVPAQYGSCTGKVNAGCAYVYGWSIAEQDVLSRGVPSAGSFRWWLDVETGNTWSRDTTANRADLEAMTTRIQQSGATVGVYSTSYQFGRIAGTLPSGSPLATLPTWLAGASSRSDAAARCQGSSFTGGANTLVQWVAGGLDNDLSCTD